MTENNRSEDAGIVSNLIIPVEKLPRTLQEHVGKSAGKTFITESVFVGWIKKGDVLIKKPPEFMQLIDFSIHVIFQDETSLSRYFELGKVGYETLRNTVSSTGLPTLFADVDYETWCLNRKCAEDYKYKILYYRSNETYLPKRGIRALTEFYDIVKEEAAGSVSEAVEEEKEESVI